MTKRAFPPEIFCVLALMAIGLAMSLWGPHDSLDRRFYYSALEAKRFLNGLSLHEATAYFRNEFFDLAFLSTYTALFFLLARRLYPKNGAMSVFAFVPGLFDLIETLTIIWLVSEWTVARPPWWLGVATCLKWTTGNLLVLALLYRPAFQIISARRRG